MKILLCKAPRYYESYFVENSESLALGYLASFLRKKGLEVRLLDTSLEGLDLKEAKERVLSEVRTVRPALIGFTIADMSYIESTVEIVKYIRRNGILSHVTAGGHSPTFDYRELLELCPQIDSIIRYEGERPLLELANALTNERGWREIPGLAFRDSEGNIQTNQPAPLLHDLDALPFPARDYLPFVRSRRLETGVVPISASRGCYYDCGFCSIREFYNPPEGPMWRTRSVENVVEEIKKLKHDFPDIKEIVFVDDIFTGPPTQKNIRRLLKLRESLRKNGLELMFSVAERVDNIAEETAAIWHDIGVRQVLIGLESGSKEILDRLNKGIVPQQQAECLKILEKYNIDPTPSFINFTPWSTLEQVEVNARYFLTLGINLLQGLLNRFQLYKGTPLYRQLLREQRIYGKFPNEKYRSIDERVDTFYHLVQKIFGPYLTVAYKLKILERELRFALFEAEKFGDAEEFNRVLQYKNLYRELMNKIMDEAVGLFLTALGYFKSTSGDVDKIDLNKLSTEVEKKSTDWIKLIEILRLFKMESDGEAGNEYKRASCGGK